MIYKTISSKETQKLAGFLFKKISKNSPPVGGKKAVVIALEGELGSGKTTFVQGFAKAVGIKSKVKSPTFNLLKEYKLPSLKKFRLLYHIDCYRLKNYKDLLHLGIKHMLNDDKNIILIEWADRVRPILPKKYVKIHIDHINKSTRNIDVKMQK